MVLEVFRKIAHFPKSLRNGINGLLPFRGLRHAFVVLRRLIRLPIGLRLLDRLLNLRGWIYLIEKDLWLKVGTRKLLNRSFGDVTVTVVLGGAGVRLLGGVGGGGGRGLGGVGALDPARLGLVAVARLGRGRLGRLGVARARVAGGLEGVVDLEEVVLRSPPVAAAACPAGRIGWVAAAAAVSAAVAAGLAGNRLGRRHGVAAAGDAAGFRRRKH